jgi:hypothetical protein
MSMPTLERFGPERRLVGVLSGAGAASQPVLVLPNAGLVPRAGPFRLHVEIAQRMEQRGIRTFRFDLPGVGESPHLAGMDAQAATRAALDHLAERGIAERFVVGGICSAADRGWLTALDDARVAGVVLLDGVCFTGPWFQLARIAGVLKRPPQHWLGVLRRHAGAGAGEAAAAPAASAYREWPTREQARAQLGTLLARDVRVLFVYTRGVSEYFRDPRQFAWSFGDAARDPRVSFHYWRDCDHTFYARAARQRLLDTLECWFGDAFTVAEPAR